MKASAKKLSTALAILLAGAVAFSGLFYGDAQAFARTNSALHCLLSLLQAFVLVAVGVFAHKKSFNFVKRAYLIAYLALFVLQLALAVKNYATFMMWGGFGMVLPVITGVSPLFTAIMVFLACQPLYEKLVANYSNKTSALVLLVLSIAAWAFSGNNLPLTSNALGALMSVLGGWGLWLAQVKTTSKGRWLSLAIFILDLACCLFFDYTLWQQFPEKLFMLQRGLSYFNYPLSVFVLLGAVALAYLFKDLLVQLPESGAVLMTAAAAVSWSKPVLRLAPALLKHSKKLALAAVAAAAVCLIVYVFVADHFLVKKEKPAPADFIAFLEQAFAKTKAWAKRHKRTLLTWLYFLAVSYLSFIIVADGFKVTQLNDVNVLAFLQIDRMFVPWLTAIFLYAAYELCALITTRYWVSLAIPTLIDLGLGVADKLKIGLRGEPIYPIELKEVVNADSLLGMLDSKVVIGLAVLLLAIVALVLYLEIKHPQTLPSWRKRLIFALIGALVWAAPLKFSDPTSPLYYISQAFNNKVTRSDPVADLQFNGPLLMMMDYGSARMMAKPAGYSKAAVDKVIAESEKSAAQINVHRRFSQKDQTIIFNLSESFTDPKAFPTAHFGAKTPDPMSFIRSLSKDSTSGWMMSAGYGGGTANMEYESLTGFNMAFLEGKLTPYQQIVPNYASYPNIGLNFGYATAIHPFMGQYYGRKKAYQIFKFDKFAYLGSKYKIYDQKKLGSDYYLSDETLYDNAQRQLAQYKQGQFINLISMQNHLPYNDWYPHNPYKGRASLKAPVTNQSYFATYAEGVRYTDEAVKQFVAYLDGLQRPVIFVFYGDHYPAIINQNFVKKYPLKLHETTYFIYSNKYAREHGAKSRLAASDYVNTSDFAAMALEQANAKVSPYEALLTKVHEELPTITVNYFGGKGFELVDKKTGKLVEESKLTPSQRKLLADFQLVQYDLTQGKGYSLNNKSFYKVK